MPEGRCRRPHRKHESIYLVAKHERHAFTVTPPVSSVWDIDIEPNLTKHTSTFPVDLPRRCLMASGLTTGIALDPFMGSGTTAIAALELGWQFVGFELDPENAKISLERITSTQMRLLL